MGLGFWASRRPGGGGGVRFRGHLWPLIGSLIEGFQGSGFKVFGLCWLTRTWLGGCVET